MSQPTVVKLSDDLYEIGARVRVERGPLMKTAMASEALFNGDANRSAAEVQRAELNTTLRGHYQLNAFDKLGKPIVPGREFAFLDWNGEWVWHVYEFIGEPWTDPPNAPAWRRRGHYSSKDEATVAAALIAGAA